MYILLKILVKNDFSY